MLAAGMVLAGKYRIERKLGQGGMGGVYLATHVLLQGSVAIKEMLYRFPDAEEQRIAIEQFQREARTLFHLSHPNLPRLYDFLEHEGAQYLVMDYIEGITLGDRVHEGGASEAEVLTWTWQLLDVLEYLHNHDPPVIFRDFKPSNIMLNPEGTIKLIDFGIAKTLEAERGGQTQTGARGAGTPGYAALEQFSIGGTDGRTDIYALGATLYALLTGTVPPSPVDIVCGEPFTPLEELAPDVSAVTADAVHHMMALRKEDRPQNVGQVRDELHGAVPIAARLSRAAIPSVEADRTMSLTVPIATPTYDAHATQRPADDNDATIVPARPPSTPPPPPRPRSVVPLLAAVATMVLLVVGFMLFRNLHTPGTLVVRSAPPGAKVEVNGVPQGVTPLTLQLAPDRLMVRLQLAGHHPAEQAVTLDAGGMQTIEATLDESRGSLVLHGDLANASILVDGAQVATATGDGFQVEAAVGKHTVKAVRSDSDTASVQATVVEGQSVPVTLKLVRRVGRLKINGTAGAEVWLDGKPRGRVPVTLSVPGGAHRLLVKGSGWQPHDQSLQLEAGETVVLNVTLQPAVAIAPVATPTPVMVSSTPTPGGPTPTMLHVQNAVILPGEGVAGIPLGADPKAVVARIPLPCDTVPNGAGAIYKWADLGLSVVSDGGRVTGFIIAPSGRPSNPEQQYHTEEGLHVGSPDTDVLKIYTADYVPRALGGDVEWDYSEKGIGFAIHDHTVSAISVEARHPR